MRNEATIVEILQPSFDTCLDRELASFLGAGDCVFSRGFAASFDTFWTAVWLPSWGARVTLGLLKSLRDCF